MPRQEIAKTSSKRNSEESRARAIAIATTGRKRNVWKNAVQIRGALPGQSLDVLYVTLSVESQKKLGNFDPFFNVLSSPQVALNGPCRWSAWPRSFHSGARKAVLVPRVKIQMDTDGGFMRSTAKHCEALQSPSKNI